MTKNRKKKLYCLWNGMEYNLPAGNKPKRICENIIMQLTRGREDDCKHVIVQIKRSPSIFFDIENCYCIYDMERKRKKKSISDWNSTSNR